MQELVSVEFNDQTSYVSYSNTDIVGCPIDHYWGPVGNYRVLTREEYIALYPDCKPLGASSKIDGVRELFKKFDEDLNNPMNSWVYPWASALRAMRMGASFVEVVRPAGVWKYLHTHLSTLGTFTPSASFDQFEDNYSSGIQLALKYPGFIPDNYGPYDDLEFRITCGGKWDSAGNAPIKIEVYGITYNPDTPQLVVLTSNLVETLLGDFSKDTIVDGKRVFIEDVVASNSNILAVKVLPSDPNNPGEFNYNFQNKAIKYTEMITQGGTPPGNDSVFDRRYDNDELYKEQWPNYYDPYKDMDVTQSTILIPSVSTHEVNERIIEVAAYRKTLNGIVGLPIDQNTQGMEDHHYGYNYSDILAYHGRLTKDMFTEFVQGQEQVTFLGERFVMDCTAAVAGRTCAVASQVRTNQLPSAKAYGMINTVLTETLQFSEVLKLHEKGIGSVYATVNGPMIFSVRSLHPRQTSYFARFNVARVTAKVLKPVINRILEAIHTDTVSDVLMRMSMQKDLQFIINQEIADRNLKAESQALITDEANSDANTRGGEILIVDLILYYKKLVEQARVRITATDSSVTTTIS